MYDTETGTALSGIDYSVFPQTTVHFGVGQTLVPVPQSVSIIPDLIVENNPPETIVFQVEDPSDSVIIDEPVATVIINDDYCNYLVVKI